MERFEVGEMITGVVTGIEIYGIFLSFTEDYTGLIHISELSEHFVKDVSEYAYIGEKITCRILEVDQENKKIKCSLRNTEFGIKKDQTIDHGFAPLKKLLPIWMDEKLKSMENNTKESL